MLLSSDSVRLSGQRSCHLCPVAACDRGRLHHPPGWPGRAVHCRGGPLCPPVGHGLSRRGGPLCPPVVVWWGGFECRGLACLARRHVVTQRRKGQHNRERHTTLRADTEVRPYTGATQRRNGQHNRERHTTVRADTEVRPYTGVTQRRKGQHNRAGGHGGPPLHRSHATPQRSTQPCGRTRTSAPTQESHNAAEVNTALNDTLPCGRTRRSAPTQESRNAAKVNTTVNGTQPDGRGMPRPYGYAWARGHRPLPPLPVQHHHLLHADIFAERLGEDRIVDR